VTFSIIPTCKGKGHLLTRNAKDDKAYLRQVELDGFILRTWETGKVDAYGKSQLGYVFSTPTDSILFTGEDFYCSRGCSVDSDSAMRSLLGFLTLRPGDTDEEYFANYNAEQLAFANNDAESLQMYTLDESDEPLAFTNLDEWEV